MFIKIEPAGWGFPPDAIITTRREPSEREKQGWGLAAYDRSQWRDGPWRDEPDIVKWIDPTTGLQCFIRRNAHGVFCGYVGVSEVHPWHGINYSGCINKHAPKTYAQKEAEVQAWVDSAQAAFDADPSDTNKSLLDMAQLTNKPYVDDAFKGSYFRDMPRWSCTEYAAEPRCETPESIIDVHGGLTFADDIDKHFPVEDGVLPLWFFGFDCGHHMDFSPGMDATTREMDRRGPANPYRDPNPIYDSATGSLTEHGSTSTYRTLAYVKAECETLAMQLLTKGEVK